MDNNQRCVTPPPRIRQVVCPELPNRDQLALERARRDSDPGPEPAPAIGQQPLGGEPAIGEPLILEPPRVRRHLVDGAEVNFLNSLIARLYLN